MSKTIIGVVVALVVVVGAVFMFKGGDKTNEVVNVEKSSPSSMKELLAMNKSQKCTFTDTVETSSNSGTTYFANGEMRGDFVSVTSAGTFTSHMILKGDDMYIWEDGTEQGFKAKATSMTGEGTKSSNTPDMNKKVDYKCEDWSGDASQFVLPDIKFMDVSAMLQGSIPGADINIDANGSVTN